MTAKTKDIIFFTWLTLLSLVAIGYGFSRIPSPFDQKDLKYDAQRVSDISGLKISVQEYYKNRGTLPTDLTQIDITPYGYGGSRDTLKDPETEKPYEYAVTGPTAFKLCATFAKETPDAKNENSRAMLAYDPYSSYQAPEFKHPKGTYCFDLQASDYVKYLKGIPVPADASCSGQSIVQSPDFQKNKALACGQYAEMATQAIMSSLGCTSLEEAQAALDYACGTAPSKEKTPPLPKKIN